MFPHPLNWECKDVMVDARPSQCSYSEGCMIFMFVEELVPRRASTALSFLLLILCSTNLYWKGRISHKWNISVNSTHQYFLLCLLSNCGKQNTLGFQSPATKIGGKKKTWISYDPHIHDVIYLQSCIFEYCIKGVLQFCQGLHNMLYMYWKVLFIKELHMTVEFYNKMNDLSIYISLLFYLLCFCLMLVVLFPILTSR